MLNLDKQDIDNINIIQTDDKTVSVDVTLKKKQLECPYCGGRTVADGTHTKIIKNPLFYDYDGIIQWHARRYRCTDCKRTFTEHNPFTFPGFSISIATLRRVILDLKNLNLTYYDIAKKNYISPSSVQLYIDSWINVPRQTLPESIGIDEIRSDMARYGSKYLCTMVDNETRQLFEILDSRSKSNLIQYFTKIPRDERKRVKYVTIDLWDPYKDAATACFPNCIVAADPFHVIKHLTEAFQKIRVNIQNQVMYGSDTYYLLKNWHYLLEKDGLDLDNKAKFNHRFHRYLNRRDIYEMLLDINENYTTAYYIKEEYRRFNKEATFENAPEWLDKIIAELQAANIAELNAFQNLLIYWKQEIINSFLRPYDDRRLSNAFTENMNGRIRSYLTVSRGNTNFARFRKRVLFALNDKVFYGLTGILKSNKSKGSKRGKYKK